jgi:glycogen debranching enzyme
MTTTTSYLTLLRNHIDITRVPFSDRGSRLLIFKEPQASCLNVKLAERLTFIESNIEAYLHRPPFINELYLVNENGEGLDFDITSTPSILYFSTELGEFGLVFEDPRTIAFGLPDHTTVGLHFLVSPQYWQTTQSGGEFKSVRNISYTTNGEVIKNQITPQKHGYMVELIVSSAEDTTIAITIQPDLSEVNEALPFSVLSEAAEKRWKDWFARVPPVLEKHRKTYAYAWWLMANNLISPYGNVMYEAMTPSKINYVGLWLWDNAMHSLAYRHVDVELARNQIRSMLAHQMPNGMLPDAIFDEGVVSMIDHPFIAEVTKPPILAWAVLKLNEIDPDLDFLQEVYIPLVRLNAWWFSMNDDDSDGLLQYNHPYSSGLDDSPLWDYGMPVESPDINTYVCVQMGSLALIAEKLGMQNESMMWRRRAESIVRRMIEDFWDEEAGLFWVLKDEQPVKVVTPFNLYPLWTGQLPQSMNDRLIEHLTNPEEFWGDCIIPTVSRSDPHYDPQRMWRGPVWANINYFFVEALRQIGRTELAQILRNKTLNMIMNHKDIHEYYNADTCEPPSTAANIFGWTAAVFIDLAIQAYQDSQSNLETP